MRADDRRAEGSDKKEVKKKTVGVSVLQTEKVVYFNPPTSWKFPHHGVHGSVLVQLTCSQERGGASGQPEDQVYLKTEGRGRGGAAGGAGGGWGVSGVESVNTCRREDQSLEQVGQRDDPSHHVVAVHQHQAVNLTERRRGNHISHPPPR